MSNVCKGVFFQKVRFVFQISKINYSKSLSWTWNLKFPPITVNNLVKFQAQDSDLEYFSEIWRFEKRITPLVIRSWNFGLPISFLHQRFHKNLSSNCYRSIIFLMFLFFTISWKIMNRKLYNLSGICIHILWWYCKKRNFLKIIDL